MKLLIATFIALFGMNMQVDTGTIHHLNSVTLSTDITDVDNLVHNDVDNPYTIEYIQSTFTAEDVVDGDVSGEIYIVLDNYSDNERNLGDYIIVFGVKDSTEQETTYSLIIRNIDVNDPYFEVEVESTLNIPQYSVLSANLPRIIAIDLHDGDITHDISIQGLSAIDTGTLGTHELIYKVSDSSGNEITQTFTVEVVDSTSPVIDGVDKIVKRADVILDGEFFLSYFSASDDHDGIVSNRIQIISNEYLGHANDPGTYQIVVSVTDEQGNFANHTFEIIVVKSMLAHLIIDDFYWVIPNNRLIDDNDFISILKDTDNLPNYEYIFTTTYDNYSNFYEAIGTYSKTFELKSSTGEEFTRDIILQVVQSDHNLIPEEPGFLETNGKTVIGGTVIGLIVIFVIYGAVKKN